jgi:hypothetical protein
MYDPDMILALSHQRRRELEAEIADARLASRARRDRNRPSLGASASVALRRFRSALRLPAKQVTIKQA